MAFAFRASAVYDSASSASAVCNKPTGTVDNDIMFAMVCSNTALNNSAPAGWTSRASRSLTGGFYQLYSKLASSEGASYTWGFAAAQKVKVTIITYTGGFDTANHFQTSSNTSYVVNNTTCRAAAATVTVNRSRSPVIVFGSCLNASAVTFTKPTDIDNSAFAEDYDGGSTSSTFWTSIDSAVSTFTGTTGTMDLTMSAGGTNKTAFCIVLNPSPSEGENRYWVGGTGNWAVTAGSHWATTSGGTATASVPNLYDTAYFDLHGNEPTDAAYTVTITANQSIASLDASFTGTTKVTIAGSSSLTLSGSLALSGGAAQVIWSHTGTFIFNSASSVTCNTNGVEMNAYMNFGNGAAGTYTLTSDLILKANFNRSAGTFSSGVYNIYLRGTAQTCFGAFTATSFIIDATAAGVYDFRDSCTVTTFTLSSIKAHTIYIADTKTLTVTNLTMSGDATNQVILSTNAGNTGTSSISKASGTVNVSYVSIRNSNATGGATFNAFTSNGNIDLGTNTGWIFSSTAIKTINGLAKASVKTFNGLAIASIKNINGLA